MSSSARTLRLRRRRIAEGLCPECGKIKVGAKYRCKLCRVGHAARMARYRAKKILLNAIHWANTAEARRRVDAEMFRTAPL